MLVNGAVADKASRLVYPGDAVVLEGEGPRFVSRGGEKLQAALEHFGVDPTGRRVLDAGASTGGFTDCLLQNGANHVVAVDVGHGQLHPRIRADSRVTVIERMHVRDMTSSSIGGAVDMVVADLSFISLTRVIVPLAAAANDDSPMILLVKPQFEAGRQEVSRGHGIITDPVTHAEAVASVVAALALAGCRVVGEMESPVVGGHGNREFLVFARSGRPGCAHG